MSGSTLWTGVFNTLCTDVFIEKPVVPRNGCRESTPEGAAVCECGRTDMVIFGLFGTQAAEGRQKGQEGEEHAQEGPSWDDSIVVAFGYIQSRVVFRTISYLYLS